MSFDESSEDNVPRLVRQGAFHQRDKPSLFNKTPPLEETKRCTICLNTREGDTKFIAPCCCRGSVQYVHEQCLKAWILRSPQCNVCLEYYSFPKETKLWHDYHLLWTFLVLLLGLMMVMLAGQIIRCSEPRKIPVSKFQSSKQRPGAPDYIWIPVFKNTCWQAGMGALLSPSQYITLFLLCFGFLIYHRRQVSG
ncbi:uncharacterized protein BX664DRAFT_204036 [Halteromyces radiatus]|uniref:uncharacterized protein n=1 Tax=Halteromyces radiatus TaxID=101107 RepID=UPI00221E97F1|nr:uncharacterized protein BX664DRAFT_204036 [Halteromyces radiatus]KAI8079871.1 hypothetical protein BX664DRAFT_204036 [Halteromyces radiatus]